MGALPGAAAGRMRLGSEGTALVALGPRALARLVPMVPHLRLRAARALGLRPCRRGRR